MIVKEDTPVWYNNITETAIVGDTVQEALSFTPTTITASNWRRVDVLPKEKRPIVFRGNTSLTDLLQKELTYSADTGSIFDVTIANKKYRFEVTYAGPDKIIVEEVT